MAKKTAKPNFDCVVVNSDDNAYFSFNGYGSSRRQFEAYVEKATTTAAKKVTTTVKKKDTQTSGIRPRIKKAIDSYEKVMDSYCEFMKNTTNPVIHLL